MKSRKQVVVGVGGNISYDGTRRNLVLLSAANSIHEIRCTGEGLVAWTVRICLVEQKHTHIYGNS